MEVLRFMIMAHAIIIPPKPEYDEIVLMAYKQSLFQNCFPRPPISKSKV
jgi:hypothetical protein